MAWPSSTEYFEAVQVPASFSDPELKQGQVAANAIGLPKACTGNFADVYQVSCPNNQIWAIKCFTREIPGLQLRYQLLSDHLRKIKFPFTVDFHYLDQGIRVRGQWYPMLKMRWVEGLTLNSLLRDQLDKPHRLRSLSLMWIRLAKHLRAGGIAHGDLQHGNVLLVPNADGTSLRLTLIDYDGMIVPALANQPSGEVGHPSYQHPERLAKGLYNPDVDRFSHLVICTALQCLMVGGKSLWDRYDNGDNLLFGKDDFADPGASPLFRELWQLPTPFAHSLVGNLILACKGPMAQVALIDSLFLDENTVVRLTAEQQQAIEKVMQLMVAVPVAMPVATAQAVKAGEWWKSPAATEKAAPSTPATVAAKKARQAAAQAKEEELGAPSPAFWAGAAWSNFWKRRNSTRVLVGIGVAGLLYSCLCCGLLSWTFRRPGPPVFNDRKDQQFNAFKDRKDQPFHQLEDKKNVDNIPAGAIPVVFGFDGVYRSDRFLGQFDLRNHDNKIHNLYTVHLQAGKSYQIDLVSTDFDAYLYLLNDFNVVVARDDDGGGNLNARIFFQPQFSAQFRIHATSLRGEGTGSYALTVRRFDFGGKDRKDGK